MQHTRDSALHLQQPVVHPPASLVVPAVPNVQNQQRESSLLSANIPAVQTGGVKCPCGKLLKDENGLKEHLRFSSRHRKLTVVPVITPVQNLQRGPYLPTANIPAGHTGEVKCPCGKLVKNEKGLKEHLQFSSRHRKLEVACIADDENKASYQTPDQCVVGLTFLLCTCTRKA